MSALLVRRVWDEPLNTAATDEDLVEYLAKCIPPPVPDQASIASALQIAKQSIRKRDLSTTPKAKGKKGKQKADHSGPVLGSEAHLLALFRDTAKILRQ